MGKKAEADTKEKLEKLIKKEKKDKKDKKPTDAAAKAAKKAKKEAKAAGRESGPPNKEKKEKQRRGGEDAEAPAKKAKTSAPVFGVAGSSAAETKPARRSPRLSATASSAVPELSLGSSSGGPLSAKAWREKHSIRADEALPDPIQTFADAPFDARILGMFQSMGWTEPSPVQAQAWPIALGGRDVIAVAKTGSGKTLGFLLPIFTAVKALPPLDANTGPLGLVLAPTRELAVQIHTEAERFGGPAGVKVACVYGGTPKGPQIGVLSRGRPAIVVATPGRINDLLSLDKPMVTDLKSCKYLVLDEADRMLDMGFQPQIDQLLNRMPQQRQTLLFTATWPKEVQKLAASYLRKDTAMLFIGGAENKLVANQSITQTFEEIDEHGKSERLAQLVRELPLGVSAKPLLGVSPAVPPCPPSRLPRHRDDQTCTPLQASSLNTMPPLLNCLAQLVRELPLGVRASPSFGLSFAALASLPHR
jgi:hypothetical protein